MKKIILALFLISAMGISLYSEKKSEIQIIKSMQAKDYDKVVSLFNKNKDKLENKPYFEYLKGNALINKKDYEQALPVFNNIIEKHANSSWATKSKYKIAFIHYKKNNFKQAYQIYKTQLAFILSGKRRKVYSNLYKNLATKMAFNKEKEKRDYNKATLFFKRALEINSKEKRQENAELQFMLAKSYFMWKKYHKAMAEFDKLIKKHKKYKNIDKAYYYAGLSNYKKRRYWNARKYFKSVIEKYTTSKDIGKTCYYYAKTFSVYAKNEIYFEQALKYYKLGYLKYKDKKFSPKCSYAAAMLHYSYRRNKMSAVNALLDHAKRFSAHEKAPHSLYLAGGILANLKHFNKAESVFKKLLAKYPNNEYWKHARNQIINVAYLRGVYSYNNKKYKTALTHLNAFISKFPFSNNIYSVVYTKGMAYYKLKKYNEAIKQFKSLYSRSKNNSYSNLGLLVAARIYTDELKDYKNGLKTYKQIKRYKYKKIAQARIKQLKKEFVSIKIDKQYLTNQTPKIKLKLRNVKKYKINVYKIDLADYFYKHHSIANVHNLDILLIKPDKTLDKEITPYQKYRLYKLNVPVALNNRGAYVIQVVTKKLTSTALLLKSDIAAVSRFNLENGFVYVKNIKTHEGEKGVDVFVSNGERVVFNDKTNEKGFVKVNLEEISKKRGINFQNLRVFVRKKNNFSFTGLSMSGLKKSKGKIHRAYIYGDKPLYRPGDVVNFKAVVRKIQDGELSIPGQKKYTVSFYSPSGNKLFSEKYEISQNGTLYGKIKLNSAISAGNARLSIISDDEKISFNRDFKIRKYTPPKKNIEIITEREAYFPGDKIKFTVNVKHFFGVPYSRRVIIYKEMNGKNKKIKTDSKGTATIISHTSKSGSSKFFWIRITLPDGTSKTKKINFKIHDFKLNVDSPRKLFIIEENVVFNIKTTNLKDNLISKKVKCVLYRNESGINSKVSQKIITTRKGKAKVYFKPKKGGKHILYVTSQGKNGVMLSVSYKINVSGKDDKNKVFVLNNITKINAGTNLKLRVFSRADTTKALLVVAGSKIYKTQAISIKTGMNLINIPMLSKYAPDISANVFLVNNKGSYFASKKFTIDNALRINVAFNKKVYNPGERVNANVTLKNINNKSVNGEVSFAVVDEAVYALIKSKLKKINKHFYISRKLDNVKYSGAMPYKYKGITKTRNKEILAESKIRKLEENIAIRRSKPKYERRRKYGVNQFPGRFSRGGAGGAGQSANKEQDNRPQAVNRPPFETKARDESDTNGFEKEQIRQIFKDSAYFNPVVKVKGNAKLSFKLPGNLTRWRVVLIAVSGKNLFGSKVSGFLTKKRVMVQANTPAVLMQGDKIKFSPEIFNTTDKNVASRLRMLISQGKDRFRVNKRFVLKNKQYKSLTMNKDFEVKSGKNIDIDINAGFDRVKLSVPVKKWAQIKKKGVSGFTNRTITRNIKIPQGNEKVKLKFRIFPHNIGLIEKLRTRRNYFFYPLTAQASASLLTDISLYNVLGENGRNKMRKLELARIIRRKILLIQAYMRSDGSFNLIKFRQSQDINTTVFNYFVLSIAKRNGFKLDKKKFEKTKSYLKRVYHKAMTLERKTLILWALSYSGNVDFSYLNRIYRLRSKLSPRSLAMLVQILINEKRPLQSNRTLSMLVEKMRKYAWRMNKSAVDFLNTKHEMATLGLLTLIKSGYDKTTVDKVLRKLVVNLEQSERPTDYFQALFAYTYHLYMAKNASLQSDYTLTLKLNGKTMINKKITPDNYNYSKIIAGSLLSNDNTLEIGVSGNAKLSYSAVIYYYKPGVIQQDYKRYGKMSKSYSYPDYTINGKTIKRGNAIVYDRIKDDRKEQNLKTVAKGKVFDVMLKIIPKAYKDKYFVVRDYVPAGCALVRKSVKTNAVYYQKSGNEIIFYFKRYRKRSFYARYSLMAVHEGKFRVLPAIFYPFNNMDKTIIGKIKNIEIKNHNYDTFSNYAFTPDELFEIAKNKYKNKKFMDTKNILKKLFDKYNLRPEYFKESAKMLLTSGIKLNNHKDVVKYFDILRERFPDIDLDLSEVLTISESYSNIGEFERAFLLLRDILQAYFTQETQLGGDLVKLEKYDSSVKIMRKLINSYPDTNNVKMIYYSFGQELYNAFTGLGEIKQKTDKGISLYNNAKSVILNFLTEYPGYENADEVSFTYLNLLVDRKRYENIFKYSELFAERYKSSKYTADYKYLSAYSLYELGQFKKAIDFAKSVAYEKFKYNNFGLQYSKNRYFAIHMLAKIYHASGDLEEAINEYRKISSRFADAQHSIDFLKRKNIYIPEVERFKPGNNPEIKVRLNGINNFEMKIYKVDFVILCLSRNNLSNIRNVNLTGIKPGFMKSIKLKPGENIKSVKLKIPVKKKGAYLVVIKSGELERSGIILLTNLEMETQSYETGRVRVLVKEKSGKSINGAKIFFKGSNAKKLVRLQSDIRGIAEAQSINGLPFVFGEYKGNYVFFRGNKYIGSGKKARSNRIQHRRKKKMDVLKNIYKKRRSIQIQKSREFQNNTQRRIRKYKLKELMH